MRLENEEYLENYPSFFGVVLPFNDSSSAEDLESNLNKVKELLQENSIHKLTYKRNWGTEKNGRKTESLICLRHT